MRDMWNNKVEPPLLGSGIAGWCSTCRQRNRYLDTWNTKVEQWTMEGAWNDPSESLLECRIQWLCEGRSMGD